MAAWQMHVSIPLLCLCTHMPDLGCSVSKGSVSCPGAPMTRQQVELVPQTRMHKPMQVRMSANALDISGLDVFEEHQRVQQTTETMVLMS